ncbi:hypothetical protein JYK14_24165 [Siccirubricoccus sp. KC 17139]|uniref:Flp family type IVb pilin n=1 Tax=Siccirubricoccus soli TaxID=2899147 RepID=A0ABT1DBB4_9PROT|nr:hypothetical protein [Siccirubricoccus soli]MCO6419233.1 hypothetical protein [Siccirubricoccus soli]MCP2685368.1 hypothetical protein [Siccirubricoccus soli]
MFQTFIGRAATALMSRKGVSAAEYAILAVGIIVVVGAGVGFLGADLATVFKSIGEKINSATPAKPT